MGRVHQINFKKPKIKFTPLVAKFHYPLFAFSLLESSRCLTYVTFYFVKENYGSFLGYKTTQELDLIKLNVISVKNTLQKNSHSIEHSATKTPNLTPANVKCLATAKSAKPRTIKVQYQHLFQGVGKMSNVKITLHIHSDVPQATLREKRIPFNLQNKVACRIEAIRRK